MGKVIRLTDTQQEMLNEIQELQMALQEKLGFQKGLLLDYSTLLTIALQEAIVNYETILKEDTK